MRRASPPPPASAAMRRLPSLAPFVALALLAACHEPTGPQPADADALAMGTRFVALADSVTTAGGPPVIARAYRGIAAALAAQGRVTAVQLTIDGVGQEWLATAREVGHPIVPCPSNAVCAPSLGDDPLEAVLLWRREEPARVVQLTSHADPRRLGDAAAWYLTGPFSAGPTLTYLDGRGGVFTETGGTQAVSVTHTAWSCSPVPVSLELPPTGITAIQTRCTEAGFRTAFSGTVARPAQFSPLGNTATGTHTITLPASDVAGARVELLSCAGCFYSLGFPAQFLPPVNLRGVTVIPAVLHVTVDSEVTMTLDVANLTSSPVVVEFPSGQQYDFVVTPSGGGAPVWTWSADRSFLQATTSRTLAPQEHWIITERWRPPAKGPYVVRGLLTSTSHFADATGFAIVP